MALRSLGSSLLAKTQPGSITRKQTEERILRPNIPGKGEVGTMDRALVEEPLMRPVAPGSEKVVSIKPSAETVSQEMPTQVAPTQTPLLAGVMGQNAMPNAAASRPGADNQALFSAGVSPTAPSVPYAAAPTAKAGRTPTASSGGGAAPGAAPATAYQPKGEITPQAVQAERPADRVTPFSVVSGLSGRAIADEPSREAINTPRNLGQGIMATLAPLVSKVNPTEGANMMKFANSQQVNQLGMGSPWTGSKSFQNTALRSIANIPSQVQQAGSNIRSKAQEVSNNLRSALSKFNPFGRR